MATQADIAKHLDLNQRYVRKLLASGILPASKGRGGMDIDRCRIAYIEYLRGVGSGQVKSVDSDNEEGATTNELLELEKLRKLQRENDIEESLTAPVELLTVALVKTASQVIPVLESIPLEMKRANPNLTGHDIQLVKKAIAKCRNAIAEMEIVLSDD